MACIGHQKGKRMRALRIVLPSIVLSSFVVMVSAAAAVETVTPVIDSPPMRCATVKGDDPMSPRVVPNLSAGIEELQANHFARAAAHFRPLAEDGNVDAERNLGALLLREGCNIPTDKKAGLSWLLKAAEKHDAEAQFLYAQALMYGNGTPEDDKGALQWAKRAANAGYMQAQVLVGYIYFAGRGVPIDKHDGIVWTVKAAEQGAPVGLSNLAKCYLKGEGVAKDLNRAMFLMAAAQQRIPPGQFQLITRFNQTRYTIARQLSVEQVRSIEKEAEKWAPGAGSLANVLADAEHWTPASKKQTGEHAADLETN